MNFCDGNRGQTYTFQVRLLRDQTYIFESAFQQLKTTFNTFLNHYVFVNIS